MAFLTEDGKPHRVVSLTGLVDSQIVIPIFAAQTRLKAVYLERPTVCPSRSSTAKLARSHGFFRGVLAAIEIPFVEVAPIKWQVFMECRTQGDKKITHRKAKELFPAIKVTHSVADALLIAEYGRRQEVVR